MVETGEKICDVPCNAPTFTVAWHPKKPLLAFACDDKVWEHLICWQGVGTSVNPRPLLVFACDKKIEHLIGWGWQGGVLVLAIEAPACLRMWSQGRRTPQVEGWQRVETAVDDRRELLGRRLRVWCSSLWRGCVVPNFIRRSGSARYTLLDCFKILGLTLILLSCRTSMSVTRVQCGCLGYRIHPSDTPTWHHGYTSLSLVSGRRHRFVTWSNSR